MPIICEKCRNLLTPRFIKFKHKDLDCLAIYNYDEEIRRLLYQFKACYDIELYNVFLNSFCNEIRLRFLNYTIVPIPSYFVANEKRGFNHVVEIAKYLKLPIINCLEKINDIKQANLSKHDRNKSINNFKLSDTKNIRNKNILIIDDVYTTGTTMEAVVKLIKSLHPKTIKILVIAKTVSNN